MSNSDRVELIRLQQNTRMYLRSRRNAPGWVDTGASAFGYRIDRIWLQPTRESERVAGPRRARLQPSGPDRRDPLFRRPAAPRQTKIQCRRGLSQSGRRRRAGIAPRCGRTRTHSLRKKSLDLARGSPAARSRAHSVLFSAIWKSQPVVTLRGRCVCSFVGIPVRA